MASDSGIPSSLSQRSASELRPIGAVAQELGLTPRAIRYYEELGLLRPAVRVKGASRLFDEADVQRLREIKRLRDVFGFSLAEIADLLQTADSRAELADRLAGASTARLRAELLRAEIELAERRLRLIERKLEQVEAIRQDEQGRLEQMRRALREHERGIEDTSLGR